MQLGEVVTLDIPAGLFDLGAQIYGTGQGLLEQLNDVQTNFQRDIDPCGQEGGTVAALVHKAFLAALRVVSTARVAAS
jgi:hypothetical protein